MIRSYPERNPFPHQGTLSIEVARTAPQPVDEAQTLPTLELDPIRYLLRLTARYLASFTSAGEKSGLPVVLTGGHGSGKTHTIRYMMNQVTSGELHPAKGILEPFVIYAKAEDPDFLKVYTQIMRQVPLHVLADLSLRLLGVIAGEQLGQFLADPKVTQRAGELLRADPQVVSRLFDRYLVGQDAVRQELTAEIYQAAGEIRDFQLAYAYLLHPELGPSAHAWLLGELVGETERRQLGVTRLLDTADDALRSLLLLATLFGRVGRPLLLFIDQYEKLVVTQDPALAERNVDLLRDLVDALPGKGILFAIAGNDQAWSALTIDLRQRFAGNVIQLPVLSLEDARHLVRLYLTAGTRHILQVLEPESGKVILEMGGHALPIRSVAVSADEKVAVSASSDGSLKVWDLAEGRELRSLRGHAGPVNAVALAPDGQAAVSASDDSTLKVWGLSTGQERLSLHGHDNWVNAVAITPDGRHAVSGSTDTTARLWDLETGRELQVFSGHRDTIWDVAVTPDGERLLTASADGALGVWALSTGERLGDLRGHTNWVNQVQVTPDGRYAVTASDDKTLRVWDLEKGQAAGDPLVGHAAPVHALALSPDGQWAVSAAIDQETCWWDLPKRAVRFSGKGTYSNPYALAVMPLSGRVVISGTLTYTGGAGDDNLYPFTGEAIQEMLRYGAGNIRRLLQICHQVFNRAYSERREIDAPLVEQTLKDGSPFYFNKQMVQNQVELALGKRGLPFQRDYSVGNIPVDLAVLAPDGSPRLLIQVSTALFKDDEATQALLSLNLAKTVQTLELNAQVLLVVLGYISPDVTPRLTEVVHNFIVYDPESFEERFAEVLDRLPRPSETSTRTQKVLQALEKQYEDLRRRFEDLVISSKQEVASLQTNVAQYAQQSARERFEDRRAEVRQAWSQKRQNLEAAIRDARKERRRRDLEDLERLQVQAERSRRERHRGFAILYGVIAIISLVAAFGSLSLGSVEIFMYLTRVGLFALAALTVAVCSALAAALTYMDVRGAFLVPPALRELAGPVGSLEELDRLARSPEIKRRGTETLLRHPNPHYRYAGAVNAEPETFAKWLVDALLAERSAVVRRALAQQMMKHPDPHYLTRTIERLTSAPADTAYLVEAAASRGPLEQALLRNLPAPLTTLAVLAGADPSVGFQGKRDSLAVQLVSEHRLSRHDAGSPENVLAEAYRSGLDRYTHAALAAFPEYQVRAAIAEISPFDEGGLGTYDSLRSIDAIDQLFLFFHQLLFYRDRDVLAGPEEAMPKTLLDGVLRTQASVLIYGANIPVAKVLDAIRERVGAFAPLDVRDPAKQPDDRSLRRTISNQLDETHKTLVVLTGAHVTDGIRAVLSEVIEGQLNVAPEEIRRLPAGCRVVAITPTDHPEEPFSSMFAPRLSATRIFDAPAIAAKP